jgi:hypothetical protein
MRKASWGEKVREWKKKCSLKDSGNLIVPKISLVLDEMTLIEFGQTTAILLASVLTASR